MKKIALWLLIGFWLNVEASRLSGLLGVATGVELLDRVEDWQISASSVKQDEPQCQEKYGRLYSPRGHSWCPAETISSEWLQLDLGFMSEVSGILTQGRSGTNQFVTKYRISHSRDAKTWQYVTDGENNQKIFPGNVDDHSLHHNYFDSPLQTRFIRIHTVAWVNYPSLRVEIVGVQDCKIELGLPPFGKITSSVNSVPGGRDCQAENAYLMSDSGWCADGSRLEDNWIQIDVGYPSTVNAIVSKGKNDFEEAWVTKYIVAYSNDSSSWSFVGSKASQKPRVFSGNFDSHSERVHFLNDPILARFIRFYPVNWNGKPGMRIGVFGCTKMMVQDKCADGYFRVLQGSRCVENIAFSKKKYLVPREARRQILKQSHRRRRHPKRPRFRSGLIRKLLSSNALRFLSPNAIPKLVARPCVQSSSPRRSFYVIDLGQHRFVSGVLMTTLTRNAVIFVYVDAIPNDKTKSNEVLCDSKSLHANGSHVHIQCRRTLHGRFLVIDVRAAAAVTLCDIRAYQ